MVNALGLGGVAKGVDISKLFKSGVLELSPDLFFALAEKPMDAVGKGHSFQFYRPGEDEEDAGESAAVKNGCDDLGVVAGAVVEGEEAGGAFVAVALLQEI
jgi:hypothetical protein